MAIVVVNRGSDWNQELYDQLFELVIPDTASPPRGLLGHYAGPGEGGWQVVDVWESREDWDRFRDEKVMPAAQEHGMPPFDSEIVEVHNMLVPEQSRA
jgi:hypothetical protein